MFHYKENELLCEQTSLAAVAAAVGTPCYVYSRAELTRRAQAYLAVPEALACFAVKANGNPALMRILSRMGLGADVTSGGELFLALHAGMPVSRIIYSGVGKREDEIRFALESGIRALHVESEQEIQMIAASARSLQKIAQVAVRVNPDIRADTHPYDSTGRLEHKFGVPREEALRIFEFARSDRWLQPVGLAAHIGSQIASLEPYVHLANYLVVLANEVQRTGIELTYIDVGGGLGIEYEQGEYPAIEDWAAAVSRPILESGYELVMEPGRSIVGPAGALVTKVLYTKEQGGNHFAIVDAGMNDLVRPAMYQAVHTVLPLRRSEKGAESVSLDVVGPVCESGDFLARKRSLPPQKAGDLLAVMQAGAYGFAMGSNYNGRLRPPEILVDGRHFHIIRKRQTFDHLLDGVQEIIKFA